MVAKKPARQPQGIPAGGQFATGMHEENGVLVQHFQVMTTPEQEKLKAAPEEMGYPSVPSVGKTLITKRTWDNGGGRMAYTTCDTIVYTTASASPACAGTRWEGKKTLTAEERKQLLADTGLSEAEAFTYTVIREDSWSKHDTPDADDLDAKFSLEDRTVERVMATDVDAQWAEFHKKMSANSALINWHRRSPNELEELLKADQA